MHCFVYYTATLCVSECGVVPDQSSDKDKAIKKTIVKYEEGQEHKQRQEDKINLTAA